MKSWGIRLALVSSALALVATSGPPRYSDTFALQATGPHVALSREAPSARFVIRARALALAPNGAETTSGAIATVRGTVTTVGGSALVTVVLKDAASTQTPAGMNVVTSFDTSHGLTFHGDCAKFTADSPCEAELELSFARIQGTGPDAVSSLDWRVDFTNHVRKDEPDEDRGGALPWVVEIEPR